MCYKYNDTFLKHILCRYSWLQILLLRFRFPPNYLRLATFVLNFYFSRFFTSPMHTPTSATALISLATSPTALIYHSQWYPTIYFLSSSSSFPFNVHFCNHTLITFVSSFDYKLREINNAIYNYTLEDDLDNLIFI